MSGVIVPFFISKDVRIEQMLSGLLIEIIMVLLKCSLLCLGVCRASSSLPLNCLCFLITTLHKKIARKCTCFILAD